MFSKVSAKDFWISSSERNSIFYLVIDSAFQIFRNCNIDISDQYGRKWIRNYDSGVNISKEIWNIKLIFVLYSFHLFFSFIYMRKFGLLSLYFILKIRCCRSRNLSSSNIFIQEYVMIHKLTEVICSAIFYQNKKLP